MLQTFQEIQSLIISKVVKIHGELKIFYNILATFFSKEISGNSFTCNV